MEGLVLSLMPIVVKGLVVPLGVPCGPNGRVYPSKVFKKTVKQAQKAIKEQKLIGCYAMTLSDVRAIEHFAAAGLAAMVAVELGIEGDAVIGTFQTLNTSAGKMLELAIKGDKIAFRLQGFGNIDEGGKIHDYTITAIHAYDPSLV